jgi:hypothetical protein
MARITRTLGPIHFEDLDPHRFEDLVRELIYDYKAWQSIEATGRTGGDEGFDIRAYERAFAVSPSDSENEDEVITHPMLGNLWMIQCKREKEITPKKLTAILDEVDADHPPYGYILAAATTFSKRSYDVFRQILLDKGVMEFYLWGRPELEDMLHLPKNDRILFTFFGISLISRRRSRSTEIRTAVVNKNKIYRVLGEEHEIGRSPILLRDAKDDRYPYKERYADFSDRPRWREYPVSHHHPLGLITNVNEYFAYVDHLGKEYDYSASVSRIPRQSEEDSSEQRAARQRIEDFWQHLPIRYQGSFCRDGLVRFDEMLVIDEKGDTLHRFPHIFVDFDASSGPFAWFLEYAKIGVSQTFALEGWNKIEIFPAEFSEPKIGEVYLNRAVAFDEASLRMYTHGAESIRSFYDLDGTYAFLEVRDVIAVANTGKQDKEKEYIEITYKRTLLVKDYLKEMGNGEYARRVIEQRVGRSVQPEEPLTIFEFRRTYEWKFDRSKIGND